MALLRLVLLAVLAAAAGPARDALAQDLERAVKATYVAKFAPFVTWPTHALGTPAAPFSICVQGGETFAGLVERAVAGQRVGGRPLSVRRMARLEGGDGCHIAFLGGSALQSPGEALQAVRGAPVLTITDEAQGSSAGVVHLVTRAGRVRFNIDAGQARAGGLAVSSKLLALAVQVKP